MCNKMDPTQPILAPLAGVHNKKIYFKIYIYLTNPSLINIFFTLNSIYINKKNKIKILCLKLDIWVGNGFKHRPILVQVWTTLVILNKERKKWKDKLQAFFVFDFT